MHSICYDKQSNTIKKIALSEVSSLLENKNLIIWVHCFEKTAQVSHLLEELHCQLAQEHTTSYPKISIQENHLSFYIDITQFTPSQMSMTHHMLCVIGDRFLITVAQLPAPFAKHIFTSWALYEQYLKKGQWHLLYQMIDDILDYQTEVITGWTDQLVKSEQNIFTSDSNKIAQQLTAIRKNLFSLNNSITFQTNYLRKLSMMNHGMLDAESKSDFNDLYIKAENISLLIQNSNNLINNLHQLHISLMSQKTNDVMRTLTIIATIFMPISFIASLYGMNFEYMPETAHPYGYFICLGAMALTVIGSLAYFRFKRWI